MSAARQAAVSDAGVDDAVMCNANVGTAKFDVTYVQHAAGTLLARLCPRT